MAEDRSIGVFSRLAALEAMSFGVIEGFVTREEVIDYYGMLFTGEEDSGSDDFWSFLACRVNRL